MIDTSAIRARFETLGPFLNERARRLFAASEARAAGRASKWNRIEHRLFAFITQNWRGKPLVSHQVVVQLIANTTTSTGLTGKCRLDESGRQ